METIPYLGNLDKPGYFDNDVIKISDFFESFGEAVQRHVVSASSSDKISHVMASALSLPKESTEELKDICSMEHLICEREHDLNSLCPPTTHQWDELRKFGFWQSDCVDEIDAAAAKQLLSLATQRQRLQLLDTDKMQRRLFFASHRYSSELVLDTGEFPHSRVLPMNGFTHSDTVITVRVYDPPSHAPLNSCTRVPKSHMVPHFSHEITCLGSSLLTSLRDVIQCQSDHVVLNACTIGTSSSTTATSSTSSSSTNTPQLAKDRYPGGFFCIGGQFYVDKRHTNTDYSQLIREWLSKRGLGAASQCSSSSSSSRPPAPRAAPRAAPPAAHNMATTRLADVSFRVGYPYLYQHQADCRHLIVLADIRLNHHSDNLKLEYPRLSSKIRRDFILCGVCGHYAAKWLTVSHDQSPTKYLYFCTRCYGRFNVADKNRRIYNYHLYPLTVPMHVPLM